MKAIKSDPHISSEADILNTSPVPGGQESIDDTNVVFSDSYDGSFFNGYVFEHVWSSGPRIKELSPDLHSTDNSHDSLVQISEHVVDKIKTIEDNGNCGHGTSVDVSFHSSSKKTEYLSINNEDNDKNHMIDRHKCVKKFMDTELKKQVKFPDVSNHEQSVLMRNGVTKCDNIVKFNRTSNAFANIEGIFNKAAGAEKPKVTFSIENSDMDYPVCNSQGTSSGYRTPTGMLIQTASRYRRSISCDPVASGETVLPSLGPDKRKFSDENFPMKVSKICCNIQH